jgi:hypothetical protein
MNAKMLAPSAALARQREAFLKSKDATVAAAAADVKESEGERANALANLSRKLKEASAQTAPQAMAAQPASPAESKARDEQLRQAGEALSVNREMAAARKAFAGRLDRGGGGGGASRGEDAVELAKAVEQAQAEAIKQVGARTFYNRGGVWVDSTAKVDAKPTVVKTFSQEYFDLLKTDATLGAVLALGGNILVMVKETLYQIEE